MKGIDTMINLNNRKSYSSSIVLIGNFSPMMFQPYWFKHCEIINDEEFNAVDKLGTPIISDQLTVFETENLAFKIEMKRFTIIAKKEPFELMLDTFERLQEKLDYVLIEKFGINFSFHVDLGSMDNFKRFGDVIAPKRYWNALFMDSVDTAEKTSGLASIIMRKQTDFGCVNVKVESSSNFAYSVFFNFNFHFDGAPEEPLDIFEVKTNIDEQYTNFSNYADDIAMKLIEEVLADGK